MKIVLVISSLQVGGAERVMSILANELVASHQVTLVTLSSLPVHYRLDPRVRHVEIYPRGDHRLVRATTGMLQMLRDLRRVLGEPRPDVVLSFLDYTNARTLLAGRNTGIPAVISERVDPRHHEIARRHRVLRRLTYGWADRFVAQTASVAIWATHLVPEEHIRVVPNPVDVDPGPIATASERGQEIIAVGRLAEQKGFDLLLRAFAQIADEHPDWMLAICGDGPLARSLEDTAAALGIARRVEFRGVVSDVRAQLRSAGLYVLSSRYEGFPNALLEAMATGTPAIATDCPSGPSEIVGDSGAAVLVPVDDEDALAAAMRALIADPEGRDALGRAGWARSQSFRTESIVRRWEELLREVVG